MPHTLRTLLPLSLLAVGASAGCSELGTEPVAAVESAALRDAGLPALPFAALTPTEDAAPDLPPAPVDESLLEEGDVTRPLQQIFRARTYAGFTDGAAFANGIHEYIGNVGAISTTVHAAFEDMHLGSYTADQQDYTPFLFDFGTRKAVQAYARVFTDKTCGLSVNGDSKHEAWWQFYQGRSAPVWGVSRTYSQAEPGYQKACARTTTTNSTGGTTGTSGMICYVLITWDLDTGQIVDQQILACTGTGNEQW